MRHAGLRYAAVYVVVSLQGLARSGIVRKRISGTQHFMSLRRGDLDALFPGLLEAVVGAAVR